MLFADMQANIPSAQVLDKYPCLFRWFDFIQHTIVPAGLYKTVTIQKPKFQQAPALPPIAPKASAAAALGTALLRPL